MRGLARHYQRPPDQGICWMSGSRERLGELSRPAIMGSSSFTGRRWAATGRCFKKIRLPKQKRLPHRRTIRVDQTGVTFRYKDRAADCHRTSTLPGEEFMRRFFQHVLPQGFHSLRYYGLWHPARRHQLDNLRNALLVQQPAPPPSDIQSAEAAVDETDTADKPRMPTPPRMCTQCGQAYLVKLPRAFPASPLGP
jgi:hypothetical protein